MEASQPCHLGGENGKFVLNVFQAGREITCELELGLMELVSAKSIVHAYVELSLGQESWKIRALMESSPYWKLGQDHTKSKTVL